MKRKRKIFLIKFIAFLLFFSVVRSEPEWVPIAKVFNDHYTIVWVVVSNNDSTVVEVRMPGFYFDTSEFDDKTLKSPFIRSWQKKPIEFGKTAYEGYPELPAITTYVVVPPNKKVSGYFTTTDTMVIDDFLIKPTTSGGLTRFSFRDDIYRSGNSFPGNPFEMDEPIVFQGVRGVCIRFYPIRYLGGDTSIVACNRVRGIIKYSDEEHIPGFDEPYYKISAKMRRLNAQFFINWEKAPYIKRQPVRDDSILDGEEGS